MMASFDEFGETAFIRACKSGNINDVKKLIKDKDIQNKYTNHYGIEYAVIHRHYDIVELLLDDFSETHPDSPILCSDASSNDIKMFDMIYDKFPDLFVGSEFTPYHCAQEIEEDNKDMCEHIKSLIIKKHSFILAGETILSVKAKKVIHSAETFIFEANLKIIPFIEDLMSH